MNDTRFRVWDGEHLHHPEEDFHHYHIGPDGGLRVELIADCPNRDDPVVTLSPPIDKHEATWYTGQEDTEGQPIYEKDVLLVKGNRYVVEFDVESGGYVLEGPGIYPLLPEIIQMGNGGAVIGNTFENPDLIDEA